MSRLVASVFGVGFLRPAPGTWGSATAVILGFAMMETGGLGLFLAAVTLSILAAFWSIGDLTSKLGEPGHHDPSWVVIDEVAGQWIALLPVVAGATITGAAPSELWPGWLAAFLLFRLFDIWKPGPIRWADRRSGTAGVVLDDLLAGAFAALSVLLLAAVAHGVILP
jgi:phosphatidylglycerophosphatase A